jgi:hypothetical protein
VTVRAVVVESSTDPSVTPCLTPSWDVTPDARVETINSETAKIHGGTGRYKVTATTAISRTLRLSATAKIAID